MCSRLLARAATRVFEASGIADQPETSTPGSADSEQRRRGDLLRLLRRCDDIDRIIGDAEAGAEAAAAAAQLRSSAATIKRMLQEADAPRPRTATATARGRVGSPPRQAQPSSGGPSARRSQRPATRQGPARGTSDPWIPPGYDGLDAAAARERQATASEVCDRCLRARTHPVCGDVYPGHLQLAWPVSPLSTCVLPTTRRTGAATIRDSKALGSQRSIVRMLQEELKVARKEHSEEVGALRRENQALRRTVASLRSEIGVVKAREGARGAEKSALKAALEAKEHR